MIVCLSICPSSCVLWAPLSSLIILPEWRALPVQGAYPALEVQWLVVKAWNLGALRRKFEGPAGAPGAAGGKDASGAAFQRAALAMLPHCPALLSKKVRQGRRPAWTAGAAAASLHLLRVAAAGWLLQEMMVEELQKAEASAGEAGGGGGGAMEVDAAA